MVLDAVLITGCSDGGLGSGIALAFQQKGLHVFATGRSLSKLAKISELSNVTPLVLEVTSAESIAAAVKAVKNHPGIRLRYLINNSGVGLIMPLLDTSLEEGKKLFDVNVWAMLGMVQAFAPLLIETKGTVVNVGSSAGVVPLPWNGVYGPSKAAENLMSETLRLELEPFGVRVITIVAGIIKTNFFANVGGFELPSESRYKSLEKILGDMANGAMVPGGSMSLEQAGREIARDALRDKTGKTYTGTLGWSAKWVPMLPSWFVDWYCRDAGKIKKLRS